ncbi:TetR/AcrR family transcriptional regulator [Sphingobium sp. TCM1]|uniref:TetR/AcrR family transcriptional regulator n=1 Tax=Sphingobium sp. TCM1 TaxID=453246 RepID=UPI000A0125D2|nr:TetR/AcrR family transcriptional regulator [Sphingobium sp. TCM1]
MEDSERAPEDGHRIRDNAVSLESPPASVLRILKGALQALGERGANRLSMSDICHVSGVSRGTLYRYFATKEDVLAAVSDYISLTFENGIRDVARDIADPVERLNAVLRYHNDYSTLQESDKTLLVEPAFVVEFFRSHFVRHRAAMRDALDPVFDHFEAKRRSPIDRDGIVEMMIRLQVSRLILPTDPLWPIRWQEHANLIEAALRDPTIRIPPPA